MTIFTNNLYVFSWFFFLKNRVKKSKSLFQYISKFICITKKVQVGDSSVLNIFVLIDVFGIKLY